MTNEESKNLELFHYGVKGMKWGVSRDSSGRSKKSGGIRQKIRERDESIQKSRDAVGDAYAREGKAMIKSAKTKVGVVRNLRDSEARSEAKAASKERREASRERAKIEKSANRKTSKEIATEGALYLIPAIAGTASLTIATAATRKNAKIGREFTAGLFSDTNGLPRPGTIALQFVDGKWQ